MGHRGRRIVEDDTDIEIGGRGLSVSALELPQAVVRSRAEQVNGQDLMLAACLRKQIATVHDDTICQDGASAALVDSSRLASRASTFAPSE